LQERDSSAWGSWALHPTRMKPKYIQTALNPGFPGLPCVHAGTTQSAEPPCT
jgi:hypothetical protein